MKTPNKIYRRARKLDTLIEAVTVLGLALIAWLVTKMLTGS